jgi:hypothetical protein
MHSTGLDQNWTSSDDCATVRLVRFLGYSLACAPIFPIVVGSSYCVMCRCCYEDYQNCSKHVMYITSDIGEILKFKTFKVFKKTSCVSDG